MHRKRTPHGYGSLEDAIQVDGSSYSCHDGLAAAPSESRAIRRKLVEHTRPPTSVRIEDDALAVMVNTMRLAGN